MYKAASLTLKPDMNEIYSDCGRLNDSEPSCVIYRLGGGSGVHLVQVLQAWTTKHALKNSRESQ